MQDSVFLLLFSSVLWILNIRCFVSLLSLPLPHNLFLPPLFRRKKWYTILNRWLSVLLLSIQPFSKQIYFCCVHINTPYYCTLLLNREVNFFPHSDVCAGTTSFFPSSCYVIYIHSWVIKAVCNTDTVYCKWDNTVEWYTPNMTTQNCSIQYEVSKHFMYILYWHITI